MILVTGTNPAANVLHVVLGPETDFWMQLHGSAAVDLSPLLSKMAQDKPVLLHLTRCPSEHEMAMRLQAVHNAGALYPYVPPIVVATPKSVSDQQQQQDAPTLGAPFPTQGSGPQAQAVRSVCRRGRCARCGQTGVELMPKVKESICFSCAALDLGLLRKSSPTDGASKVKVKTAPPTSAVQGGAGPAAPRRPSGGPDDAQRPTT